MKGAPLGANPVGRMALFAQNLVIYLTIRAFGVFTSLDVYFNSIIQK